MLTKRKLLASVGCALVGLVGATAIILHQPREETTNAPAPQPKLETVTLTIHGMT